MAVGSVLHLDLSRSDASRYVSLVERWNGVRWANMRDAAPRNSRLLGVSCPSVSACMAVGTGGSGAVAEWWNGSRWSIQRTPNPVKAIGLTSVSCVSARDCTAVGPPVTFADGVGSGPVAPRGFAERWNGMRWSSRAISALREEVALISVSCATSRACTAVGTNLDGTGAELTVAERWSGLSWSSQPTPNPSLPIGEGIYGAQLDGVSCTSGRFCVAVGSFSPATITNPGGVPLLERYS